MKRNIRILAVLLVICLFVTSINIYALDINKVVEAEHTFTKAELACMSDENTDELTRFGSDFIEIKNIEGKTTRADTVYFIIECDDGYMLSSPSSGTFSRTRYGNGGTNNERKWIFREDSNGDYIVYSYTDNTKCLTVNPSTKAVTLSPYTGSQYQKWMMYYSSNGNTLKCMASDSRVSGYKLVIGSTSCSVSNTTYTPVGFFDVSWYVPTTALSYTDFYLALDQSKTVKPQKTPTNAICSNNWIKWRKNNSKITIADSGRVTGVSAGTTILGFMDKITRKSGSCLVTVMPIANGTYFLRNKQNSYYARVKNGTMTNGQNVVQYDFDGSMAERWIFTLDTTTGYFSIKSANSGSNNYYMAVSDDSSALDKPIVIRSATESTLTDGMKWKVETAADGAYKIIPKTGEATNYVLATIFHVIPNNKDLVQGDYLDNNHYYDEWFLTAQRDYVLMYIGYEVGDPKMPPIVYAVSTELETKAGMDGYGYTTLTKEELLAHLSSTTVFSCITHGSQTQIATADGYIKVSDINSLDSTAFNNLKFVYFGACETGKGGSGANNLVNAVYNKGADAVLGFKINVFVDETNLWTEKFMVELANGATLSSAMSAADYAVRIDPDLVDLPYFSTSSEYRYLQGSNQMIPCS